MEAIDILATVAILAGVVTKITERIRKHYPWLEGGAVAAIASGLGIAIAVGLDLRATEAIIDAAGGTLGRTPAAWLDYGITGIAIGFGAGIVADAVNRSGAAEPPPERILITDPDEI